LANIEEPTPDHEKIMDFKISRRYLFQGLLFAALIALTIWLVSYFKSPAIDDATDQKNIIATANPTVESADIIPLSSVHESLVEIEGNYLGYARHLLHLLETDQAAQHYIEAMLISSRMQETIAQALEFAREVKDSQLLRNGAAQSSLVKAADAYTLRAQSWEEHTRHLLRLIETARMAPGNSLQASTPEERRNMSRRLFPAGGAIEHFGVEQHLTSAYRSLGYTQGQINFNRGGLLKP